MKNKIKYLLLIAIALLLNFNTVNARVNEPFYNQQQHIYVLDNYYDVYLKIKDRFMEEHPGLYYFTRNAITNDYIQFAFTTYDIDTLYLKNDNYKLYLCNSNYEKIYNTRKYIYQYYPATGEITKTIYTSKSYYYVLQYQLYSTNYFLEIFDTNINILFDENSHDDIFPTSFTINYSQTSENDKYIYSYKVNDKIKFTFEIYNYYNNQNPYEDSQTILRDFYNLITNKISYVLETITNNYVYLFAFSIPLIIFTFFLFYKLLKK